MVGSGFNRQIRHQRGRKPPGTEYQLEIWRPTSWIPPSFIKELNFYEERVINEHRYLFAQIT